MAGQIPAPPRRMLNEARIRTQFGAERADLLLRMFMIGDPLADAVIIELDTYGPAAKAQLAQGLASGLASLTDPYPAIAALLQDAETLPAWVDPERLARGVATRLAPGDFWINASLGPGSLVHTYSSPSIARQLVTTGSLVKMASRRLIETGVWNIETAIPGGLERGAKGYIATLQVRLLHARMRATFLKRGWDVAEWGAPINQVEMLRTWFDFTYIPINALNNFGIRFSDQEVDELYHLWQYIAHLLGIEPLLFRQITSQAQAAEWLTLINSTSGPPDENSRALVAALLDSYGHDISIILKIPEPLGMDLAHAFARHLHGDATADTLRIGKRWIRHLFPLMLLNNRIQGWRRRVSPAARARAIEQSVANFRGLLVQVEGDTAYQAHSSR